jgi:transcriptional regulator with PAS, ATPase and Fis domain
MITPIVGESQNIKKVREVIDHIADTGLNTVIYGESGVGKEVIAQNLYNKSPRKGQPFIKINCAALPEGLLESELFGYERGAFTGADSKKRGKFELANRGVLLLDEIGDMSLHLQSKLLHVLQGSSFAPLGSEKEVETDTWVIAATNHDLEKAIEAGLFREDLYYRLNIIKIHILPLRDRPEDIKPLVEYYLDQYTKRFNCTNPIQINKELLNRFKSYRWPGNVRELQNVLKRMLVLDDFEDVVCDLGMGGQLSKASNSVATAGAGIPSFREFLGLDSDNSPDQDSFSLKKVKKAAVDRVEREVISYVLEKVDWNRSKASKILKISYKTLLYKIDELSISPPSK